MKALKTVSSILLIAGLAATTMAAQAEQSSDVTFMLTTNASSPEANVFVPTEQAIKRFVAQIENPEDIDMFANPFLSVEWEIDVSLELDDAKLIEKTRI